MQSLASQLVRLLPHSVQSTDGELLAGFLSQATEDSFTELVRRHGPLVWGVCRRTLPDLADAEDAFQATFLVLVRRGRKLTRSSTIGPWLHRVATWTARNVRRGNARRLAKRAPISELAASTSDPDLALDLDSALLALPEKYRSPIVLCHLLGYSRADAAMRLGCPEGTVSAWLARGLVKLREKLGDLDPAKPLGVVAVSVPAALAASTVKAAEASLVAVAVSSTVSHVVEGVLRMFWIKKATAATLALCAMFTLGVGVGITGRQVEGVAGAQTKAEGKAPAKGEQPPTVDGVITELKQMIALNQYVKRDAEFGVLKITKKIELAKSSKTIPARQRANDLRTLARFMENADDAETRIKHLSELVQKLEAATQKAKNDPDKTKELAATLKAALRAIEECRQAADRATAEAKNSSDSVSAGYLELTIHGKAGQFEFSLRETDAAGREIGSVRVAQPAMLQKMLARAKLDPTAPKELRVIAEPSTSLGGGPTAALTACDAAGFKTVKFTGYVPAGGFIPPLNLNQKGDAPGYTRYEKKERTAKELLKEIGEGMIRS